MARRASSESTKDGDGYQKARRAFGVLLAQYGQAMYFASRYVGGLYVSRSHKGDADAQPPFVVVEPAKQREALTLLEEKVFSDKPFQFPPEMYNHLAASAGRTGAPTMPMRTDYPVHEVIAHVAGSHPGAIALVADARAAARHAS